MCSRTDDPSQHEENELHTQTSAVQFYGRYENWPADVTYVGMAGNPSRAFGIPDELGDFGKPWACLDHPDGWPTGYLRHLVDRLAADPAFQIRVRNLHGKTLLCWCAKKDAPRCHAIILSEFVELLYHGQL